MGSSGKGGGGGSSLKDYYASFAALAGSMGTADALVALLVDGEEVWRPTNPILRSGAANPYQFDVADRGRVYFYWGTAGQTLTDPVLSISGRGHPAMRYRPVVVFQDFLCGRERTSLPDIGVVTRRAPDQSLITGGAAALDSDGQVNPLAFLAEALTHPVLGLGRGTSLLDLTSWQATADALDANAATEYLTLRLEGDSVRDLFAMVNGYNETWFRLNAAGAIEAGRFLTGADVPADLPIWTEHDLTEIPQIEPVGFAEVDGRIELEFTNRDLRFERDFARSPDTLGRELRGEDEASPVRRDAIRRAAQAQAVVNRISDRESRPYDLVSLKVRESRGRAHLPGDLIRLTYTPTGYSKILRLLTRTGDSDAGGDYTFTAESERLISRPPHVTPYVAPPIEAEADLAPLPYGNVIQLPAALADGQPYRLAPLLGRDNGLVTTANLYFQGPAESNWQFLGQTRGFAVPVEFAAGYADTASGALSIRRETGPAPLGWSEPPTALSDDEVADDTLLLLALAGSDPAALEVFSVALIGSPSGGAYPVTASRARRGTAPQGYSTGDRAWLIRRSALAGFSHASLAAVAGGATAVDRTVRIKAVPLTSSQSLGLDDVTSLSLVIRPQAASSQQTGLLIIDGNGQDAENYREP